MLCPECGGDYRQGIDICPTCEVPLRSGESAGLHSARGPRLVPSMIDLIGYVEESEAREARRRLKEAKIPCEMVIRDATDPGVDPETEEEYWIRIPGAYRLPADEILNIDSSLEEDNACPSCGIALADDQNCPTCAP